MIAWIAAQPWCTGTVGMIGISWGGFNSLQIAARRPPALKAIITLCSTDDRYADDVHYMGGACWHDMLPLGACDAAFAMPPPPDPAIVGERWREHVAAAARGNQPLIATLAGPPAPRRLLEARLGLRGLRGDRVPVLAVGGWADGYTNAILRLLEGLPGRAGR